MKQNDPHSRLHWPREGVAIRVPPRRLAGHAPSCELIAFSARRAEPSRRVAWDALAAALPRGTRVVLLVAAEDVSFTAADVPALSGLRLREALPNLVEDRTVGEIGSLHVALGQSASAGRERTLAMVDRAWLAIIQTHVVRAGHRVAAVVPESLAVPLAAGGWSLACVGGDVGVNSGSDVDRVGLRCWLRTGSQQSMLLPDDAGSAVAIAQALARQGTAPTRLACYAAPSAATASAPLDAALASTLASTLASALDVPLDADGGDPFAAWLAGDGPDGGYGPALSLLAFDGSRGGVSRWSQWRLAAALAFVIVAVQIVGMQWQWAGLRREANALRQDSTAVLTTTFPETRVVLDAPLQMARGLARLRASSGRSDPGDFTMMMAASARIFAALPSNALRASDFDAHALKLRFAPGMATAPDERERFVAQAAQEGYTLAFDANANAAGESSASLQVKRGA
jgi:general secretion pathway protein L